eukprot:3311741-Rhodomonas_salina.8
MAAWYQPALFAVLTQRMVPAYALPRTDIASAYAMSAYAMPGTDIVHILLPEDYADWKISLEIAARYPVLRSGICDYQQSSTTKPASGVDLLGVLSDVQVASPYYPTQYRVLSYASSVLPSTAIGRCIVLRHCYAMRGTDTGHCTGLCARYAMSGA